MIRKLTLAAALVAATTTVSAPAVAGTDQYLGEIQITPYTFCPRGWIEAAGQLLPIAQNSALFSLYGTIYGGDGRTTFGVPDLRGRTALGFGHGPGLSNVAMGQKGGAENVTLNNSNLPSHAHGLNNHTHGVPAHTHTAELKTHTGTGDTNTPAGSTFATWPTGSNIYKSGQPDGQAMASGSIVVSATPAHDTAGANGASALTGGQQPFGIRSPYLGLKFCVATVGIFPSRN